MKKAKSNLPPILPSKQTDYQKALILEACKGLRKMFGKRKWFSFVGQGSVEGEFVMLVGSKTKVSPRRADLCTAYMGLPVVICGPWKE